MSQSIRMKLRSLYKSHWTCCRTLTLTKRTECLGLYELYPTKIYQCTKMILICHIVGAKLGTCRNPESYPDLFSLCVYIYIYCLETTTTSCSSKWAYRPTQSISSHPKPKVQQDFNFQLLLWSISALLLSLTHSPKSFPPIPNKNSDLKAWNFLIFARRFAPTWRHYCNMVIRKSAGWWRSTWAKWQVLRHERKPCVAR